VFQTTQKGIKQKRFCSAECKANYWTDQRCPGRHDERTCRACGAQFEWDYRGQYYCGTCRTAREQKEIERYEEKTCPNCGKAFLPERRSMKPRRFCSRECNVAWWSVHRDLYKSPRVYKNPERRKPRPPQGIEGYKRPPRVSPKAEALRLRAAGHKYAAIARSLGLSINTVKSWCLRAGMGNPQTYEPCVIPRKVADPQEWLERLNALGQARGGQSKQHQRVFLACGVTRISGNMDVLCAVVEYRLKMDPYNGDIYVFSDWSHKRLKWISWDGSGFCMGLRRMEYGVYPWPSVEMGKTMELNEKEFSFLLSCTAPQKRVKNEDFA
jgi:transposase